jgi:hypothetical protein
VSFYLYFASLRESIRTFHGLYNDISSASLARCGRFSHAGRLRKAGFMAKQTKITIETESLLILRGRSSAHAWCPHCAAESEMIAIDRFGVISNLERSALEEWLNSGELHQLQSADGSTLICLNSLLARVRKTKTFNRRLS